MRNLDSRPINETAGCIFCINEKIQRHQEMKLALDLSQYPRTELKTIKKGSSRVYACERHYREEMGHA